MLIEKGWKSRHYTPMRLNWNTGVGRDVAEATPHGPSGLLFRSGALGGHLVKDNCL